MHSTEFLEDSTGASETAGDAAIELELVDFSIAIELARVVRVRAVQILPRSRGDAKRPRRTDVDELRFEHAVVIEDLDATVLAIRNVHVALQVYHQRMRHVELSGRAAKRSP